MKLTPEIDQLQDYLLDVASKDEARQIEARLLQEPALADLLIRLAADEVTLKDWSETPTGIVSPLHASRRQIPPAEETRRMSRWVIGIIICGCTVLALIVLAVTGMVRPEQLPDASSPSVVEVGRIGESRGDVRIVLPSGITRPARAGNTLHSDQEIRTGPNSLVAVHHEDGGIAEIGAESTIRFTTWNRQANRHRSQPRLELDSGRVFITRAGQTDAGFFAVRTPHVDVHRAGSQFRVTVTDRETRIDAHQGDVGLLRRRDRRRIDCRAGQFVAVHHRGDVVSHRLPARRRQTIELQPIADSYVTVNHPRQSFGVEHKLLAGESHTSFLQFRLPRAAIRKAVLVLTVRRGQSKGWITLAQPSGWSEKNITGRHHPGISSDSIAEFQPVHGLVRIAIKPHRLRAGLVTICVRSKARWPIEFSSREAKRGKPVLILTIEHRDRFPHDHQPHAREK